MGILSSGAKSWLHPERLKDAAARNDLASSALYLETCNIIAGADTGCRGEGRMATVGKNSPSCVSEGGKLADGIQSWLRDRVAAGPFSWKELLDVWNENDISVIPIKVNNSQTPRPHQLPSKPTQTPKPNQLSNTP